MTDRDRQPEDAAAPTGEPVVSKPYIMPDDPEPGSGVGAVVSSGCRSRSVIGSNLELVSRIVGPDIVPKRAKIKRP